MTNEEIINELGLRTVELIDEYGTRLETYEIANQLILNATSMILSTSPNELLGIKTVLASVMTGISDYENNHS